MTTLLGLIFSARSGGNLYDLAQQLFSMVSKELPGVGTELIEISKHKVNPCNGCKYECLLGEVPLWRWRGGLASIGMAPLRPPGRNTPSDPE
ncbi:MAG: hypothetical protein ACYC9Q_03165 [Bacillota bacterium]